MSSRQATTESQDPSGIQKALYSVEEVAHLVGCSVRTIYRYSDGGLMPPPIKIGSLVRWRCEVIASWIAEDCPRHRPLRRVSN